jgi:hypothetical protein
MALHFLSEKSRYRDLGENVPAPVHFKKPRPRIQVGFYAKDVGTFEKTTGRFVGEPVTFANTSYTGCHFGARRGNTQPGRG